jgi:hypothetical protein
MSHYENRLTYVLRFGVGESLSRFDRLINGCHDVFIHPVVAGIRTSLERTEVVV